LAFNLRGGGERKITRPGKERQKKEGGGSRVKGGFKEKPTGPSEKSKGKEKEGEENLGRGAGLRDKKGGGRRWKEMTVQKNLRFNRKKKK